jgi:hypothetical protein
VSAEIDGKPRAGLIPHWFILQQIVRQIANRDPSISSAQTEHRTCPSSRRHLSTQQLKNVHTLFDQLRIVASELPLRDIDVILEPNAHVPAEEKRLRDHRRLRTPKTERRPLTTSGQQRFQVKQRRTGRRCAIFNPSDQLEQMRPKIRECWVLIGSHFNLLYPEQGRQRTGLHNHQTIVDAVAARDPQAVRAALEFDLGQSLARLHASLTGVAASAQLHRYPSHSSETLK